MDYYKAYRKGNMELCISGVSHAFNRSYFELKVIPSVRIGYTNDNEYCSFYIGFGFLNFDGFVSLDFIRNRG